jgi:hypothetical protein
MQRFGPDSGIYNFLITYRKILRVLCVVLLLLLPYKIFHAPVFELWQRYQAIGYWLDTFIQYGIVPIIALIYIRKAVKASKSYER